PPGHRAPGGRDPGCRPWHRHPARQRGGAAGGRWAVPAAGPRAARCRVSRPVAATPLLHISEEAVATLLPPPAEAVALARRALEALADGTAELPPKPAVHPRADGFANAMPAYLHDGDLLGLKWIAAYPGNASP